MIKGIASTTAARPTDDLRRAGAPAAAAATAPTKAGSASEGGVSIEAKRLVAEGPPVEAARVAAIREGLANGSYRVDPDQIAQAMIVGDLGVATRL